MEKKVQRPRYLNFFDVGESSCIIEFQAFRGNLNEFIVKELFMYDINTNTSKYFLFKAPYRFSKLTNKFFRVNNWLINHFHKITWNEGFIEYNKLNDILNSYCKKYETIYTTGNEKCQFLRSYTSANVIDINIPKTNELLVRSPCVHVKDNQHKFSKCAIIKTYSLLEYLKKSS